MALVLADLVQETTSTTGTGTLTLTGPVPGYQSFATIGSGNTTMYRIKSGEDSEVGLGTYNGTLSRDTVYMSIIAGVTGTTKIDVAAGATVICTYPAERAVALVSPVLSGSLADPLLDLTQAWGGTTGNPTAIKLNVTGSAGSTAKLMDLQVGGASKFSVDKFGSINNYGLNIQTSAGLGTWTFSVVSGVKQIQCYDGSILSINPLGNNVAIGLTTATQGLTVKSTYGIAWDNGSGTADTILFRDAANTLAQRNSTNAQTFRLYNTYTDASNYVRTSLSSVTYSGAVYSVLAAESAGTGEANIGIALSPKGTGAITAQVPDGTTAGGNARGANSVDLQMSRVANTQVASLRFCTISGGSDNRAS